MSIRDYFRSASPPRETAAPSIQQQMQVVYHPPVDLPAIDVRRSLPAPAVKRMYQAAKSSYLTPGFGQATGSSDTEIRSSLTNLRARSRALVRDSAYAKRASVIVVNNVIGGGMGLQAQVKSSRRKLLARVNTAIETAWERWSCAEYCHTGGTLHFSDFERALMGEVFEAGEVFVRMHTTPFGGSDIPFALELIESERVPHEFQTAATGDNARLGIEVDKFYRPLRYWIRDRHPSDLWPGGTPTDMVRPVPASEIIHLRIVERWPQTRGVPWMHATLRKLNDMDGYTEAEITAARAAAMYLGWEENPDPMDPSVERQDDGSFQMELQPNTILRPRPGTKLNFYTPNRPNSALDAFMRYMLREFASGTGYGMRYSSLSGDYSQATYSSERAAQLDDRDGWRALQAWWMRAFRAPVHKRWLQQSVFAHAIEGIPTAEYMAAPEKFEAVKYKARGWSWIDPTKEVQAYKEAEKAGYITKTQIIAQTAPGQDVEDVLAERRDELDMAAELGLTFDTDPGADQKAAAPAKPEEDNTDAGEPEPEEQQRMRVVK